MKTLILELDNEYGMLKTTDEIDYYNYYKYDNKNIFQKIIKKMKLGISYFFFGEWKKKLEYYDCAILFDRGFNSIVSKYIKKKNPNIKVILWLWNPVGKKQKQFMEDRYIDEVWTYDSNDAEKYNIKLNTQFYNDDFVKCLLKKDIKYDLMFVGFDKGRREKIEKISQRLQESSLNGNSSLYIKIIDNQKDAIPYKDYLDILSSSRTILDIVNEGVSGLTLRVLESIYFGKKLITNNPEVSKYDFYNPNNIFIIKNDNLDGLLEFMKKDYEEIDKSIIENYEYCNWVKRFKTK